MLQILYKNILHRFANVILVKLQTTINAVVSFYGASASTACFFDLQQNFHFHLQIQNETDFIKVFISQCSIEKKGKKITFINDTVLP